ncbi:hypothetical protein [Amycolatopsis sp. w19]|uniref:hypothetical protein n=1 Tax=Amycolatopsis sp. w19 TaxID=3448134 RepID=UPI003F1A9DB9
MRATATILAATALLLFSCSSPAVTGGPAQTSSAATTPTTSAPPPTPVWQVGAKPLPLRRDGFGQILPTPPVLANRSLPTADLLPPPAGNRFAGTVNPVPAGVLARSTWQPACPVTAGELRYLTLSFWGFDGRAHTGEMLVNASVANAVVTVFGQLFAAKFPIEAVDDQKRGA